MSHTTDRPEPAPTPLDCAHCAACCCRLEVWCFTETGIPRHMTRRDPKGGLVMARLDDGWCVAVDRETYDCRIYARRPDVCRELEMGGADCLAARAVCVNADIGP